MSRHTALLDDPAEAVHVMLNSMLPGVWCPEQLEAATLPVPNMLYQLDLDNLALGFGTADNGQLGVARTFYGTTPPSGTLVLHPVEGWGTACKSQVYWYLSTTGMRYGLVCHRQQQTCPQSNTQADAPYARTARGHAAARSAVAGCG